MNKCIPLTAVLVFVGSPSFATMYEGVYRDHGGFETIRLQNGEMLDIASDRQNTSDHVYGKVKVRGKVFTIYDGGVGVGPIYAVSQ